MALYNYAGMYIEFKEQMMNTSMKLQEIDCFHKFINKINTNNDYKISYYDFNIIQENKIKLAITETGDMRIYKIKEKKFISPLSFLIIYVHKPPKDEDPHMLTEKINKIFSSYTNIIYLTNTKLEPDYLLYRIDLGPDSYYNYFMKTVNEFSLNDYKHFENDNNRCCII